MICIQRQGLLTSFGKTPKEKSQKSRNDQTRCPTPESRGHAERCSDCDEGMEQVSPRAELIERILQKENAFIERGGWSVKTREKNKKQRRTCGNKRTDRRGPIERA